MSRTFQLFVFVSLLLTVGLVADAQHLQLQADNEQAEMLNGKVMTSNGKPAKNAIVHGITRQSEAGLLANIGTQSAEVDKNGSIKMQTHPIDRDAQPFIGPASPFATKGNVWTYKTNDEGEFGYPSNLTSFFIQSQDGTDAAFVPPGAVFPIKLLKCAKLKINNSILSKKKAALGKGSVTVVWQNCLAGAYPLLYPPRVSGEIDPDLPPRDWRIYPYFNVATRFDDIDLDDDWDIELLLPPGEVGVSVLTDKQREHIAKIDKTSNLEFRQHFPMTCGIVSLSNFGPTQIPLKLGTCITGKIVAKKNANSALPNWSPSDRAYSMRVLDGTGATVVYPKIGKGSKSYADKYRRYQEAVPKIVKALTEVPGGLHFRIQNQVGVIPVRFDKDGNFTTHPLPDGSFYCDVTSCLKRSQSDSNKVSKAEIGSQSQISIPSGYMEIRIKVSGDGMSELVRRGDVVDLILKVKETVDTTGQVQGDGNEVETALGSVLKNIQVCGVFDNGVSVSVTKSQAKRLEAANNNGLLRLVIRERRTNVFHENTNNRGSTKCILQASWLSASAEERESNPELQRVANLTSGGFFAHRSNDGNIVFKTKPNAPFFNAGEFVAVPVDEAKVSKSKVGDVSMADSPKDLLRAEIARQFDSKMEHRNRELNELEAELEAARSKLELRQLQRDEIVERRLRKLTKQKKFGKN